MRRAVKNLKKAKISRVKRNGSKASEQVSAKKHSSETDRKTNENSDSRIERKFNGISADHWKRNTIVPNRDNLSIICHHMELENSFSSSKVEKGWKSRASSHDQVLTRSHTPNISTSFINIESASRLSMRTVQTADALVYNHEKQKEKEGKNRKRRRRRRGGWLCTPWCCCCCSTATVLILAGITALVLALITQLPQPKRSTTSETVTGSTPISTTSASPSGFNQTCTTDANCNGTLLLTCQNSTCVCNGSTTGGNWFWSGSSCLLCPQQWMIFGTHCYYLSNTTKTWNDSRTYCMNHGADLLVIQSLAEYNFITSVAQTLMPTTNWVQAWVGLITLVPSSPGLFQWLDGTNITGLNPPNYIWCKSPNWYNEPDFQSRWVSGVLVRQMCCGLVHAMPPNWPTNHVCVDDNFCDDAQLFICEKAS